MNNIQELIQNTELIGKVNASIPRLRKCFEKIISYSDSDFANLSKDATLNIFYQNFIEIVSYIPLMATIIDVPYVVRGRANYNGEIFNNKKQISFNTECPEKIEFGRFNLKAESLFYASLPTELKNVDYVLTCALECCKELTAKAKITSYQDITIGGWTINENLPIVNLCFDEEHLKENPSLALGIAKYFAGIESCFSVETTNFIRSFLYYFSGLSGTKSNSEYHYFATTALFHAIRNYYNSIQYPKFGLIYPSAVSEKKGLNIVLTPDAVNKFLSLEKVIMYRYIAINNSYTDYVADRCSDLVYPDKEGSFTIVNYMHAKMSS
ncbi:hypothetical protein KO02_13385 [Sphingobacterium sp. ML3W]|uniref:hypothetical protein n=1 Tax=Sphingobacterium sp. ML3W TaxID=1538644 RepID=UPI0004F84D7F|nr:hypothetical protein [Sphingobacterium sp. ML3W]AIM37569.1 hypothetical protein KO02_13385 [Sphingobacterium sp. ML3W]